MLTLKDDGLQVACVGQLLDFIVAEGYKVKYLRVAVSEQEYWFKLSKEVRRSLDRAIAPGCWLEISGRKKICKKTGKLKLKADCIRRVAALPTAEQPLLVPQPSKAHNKKTTILVCQKSDCLKRGGRAVSLALAECLRDRGLEDNVDIKMTGCLKQCKKGPNLVVMPDKARYSQIAPPEIPPLIDKHCGSKKPAPLLS